MNIRYLNEKKIASQETIKKILLIIAVVFGDFNLFGLTLTIVKDRSTFGICFTSFFLIIDIIIFWAGLRVGRLCDAARRYETIFGSDEDGFVTIGEMTTLLKQPPARIFNEVRTLFIRKYFINCAFETRGEPAVIIFDAIQPMNQNGMNPNVNNGVGFVVIKCPNCGTLNRVRAGSMGKCIACQAPVSGVVDQRGAR